MLPISVVIYFISQYALAQYGQNLTPARKKLWDNDMGRFLSEAQFGEKVQLFIVALLGFFSRIGMVAGVILWIISLT